MSINTNPEMFVLARESRGITQSQLAEAASVTQAKISRYEGGLLTAGEEDLAAIAKALDYPVEFFQQQDRVFGFGTPCIYHRKRQSLPVSESKKLHAIINVVRMEVSRLLRSVEIDHGNKFRRIDMDEYDGGPEEVARMVRGWWGCPAGPIRNLTASIENAGGIVFRCDFGTRKIDAASQWPPELPMPPLFFANAEIPGDRLRFTLAHEIGHVFMHGIGIPPNDLEAEANQFASEFLMPRQDVIADLSSLTLPKLADLKGYWKVSMGALLMRAKDLGTISDWQYRTLWERMGQAGYRKTEPVAIPIEEPTVINDVIAAHRDSLGFSIQELSRTVRIHEHEFVGRFLPGPVGKPNFKIVG